MSWSPLTSTHSDLAAGDTVARSDRDHRGYIQQTASRGQEPLIRSRDRGLQRWGTRMQPTLGQAATLTGKEDLTREHLDKKIPQSVIARLLNVHRLTVRNYIRTRKLQKPAS